MHARHVPHVMADAMVVGRLVQVFEGLLAVAVQFVLDADVQVGVEELAD